MIGELEPFDFRYPARRILDIIGDKWTPIILYCIGQDVRRFNEMQRAIPDISKKMLTKTLRNLERDGLVLRTVYPEVPPRTDYRLTGLGQELREPIAWLCTWAAEHQTLVNGVFERRAVS